MKTSGADLQVYEYGAWGGYLLPACLPEAERIPAVIGEPAEAVLAQLSPRCRAFIFHLNMTVTRAMPCDRRRLVDELRRHGITVLNAGIEDISKRHIQTLCSRAEIRSTPAPMSGDPDELVIVKTNYNYHGAAESRLSVEQLQQLRYPAPHGVPRRSEAGYRIVRRAEVDPQSWDSPHWVVERFITNALHQFHRVYVAGGAMVVSRVFDPSVFKKMPEGIDRESFFMTVRSPSSAPEVPAAVQECGHLAATITRAAQIDYAAYDIVNNDRGEFFLVDINTTPHWGDGGHPVLLSYLADGLGALYHAH